MVRVHYRGTLENGSVFDTSHGKEPLEFAIGWGEVIPGFEEAVIGMRPGESRTVQIPMTSAYGPRDEQMVGLVDKADFPPEIELRAGLILQVDHPEMPSKFITVLEVLESTVLLDGNHPLAGKDLTYEIELVEIM